MAVWDKISLCSFLLLVAGAVDPSVNYSLPVCAVRSSTVTLPCTFTPVRKIIRVVWCQNHLICHGATPSVYDSDSKTNNPFDTRYKYLGDKTGNCTLQISNLQKRDEATFRFRMEADDAEGHWTEKSGVNVTVVDGSPMKITSSSEREVREGQSVTLLCTSICTFHQLQVTWFRGDHPLPESGPALRLSPLTAEDSGNYTCGLKANQRTRSVAYELQVAAADGGGGVTLLIVGVLFGVLLAVCALILVVCIIKRKRAAAERTVGGQVGQKLPDSIYSDILLPAEHGGGGRRQETSQAVEELSYASVQFKHKKQARPVEEAEDAIIYSSVATRG
ncbi:uncharacterized protein LOC111646945 [Seriola lalandi dorsalis]|uniref:Uncharacterized LOC111646945 n=1 Tax=Seriola lalandi dorsalis TaxID=1841481 RepID=A0A3B4YBL3_SERLL|nr:uncharacterized protein LOC111646945 [Seriola lalandi dorsalis]